MGFDNLFFQLLALALPVLLLLLIIVTRRPGSAVKDTRRVRHVLVLLASLLVGYFCAVFATSVVSFLIPMVAVFLLAAGRGARSNSESGEVTAQGRFDIPMLLVALVPGLVVMLTLR